MFQKEVLYWATTSRILNSFWSRKQHMSHLTGRKSLLTRTVSMTAGYMVILYVYWYWLGSLCLFLSVQNQIRILHYILEEEIKRSLLCPVSPSEFNKDCKEHIALIIKLFFFSTNQHLPNKSWSPNKQEKLIKTASVMKRRTKQLC